jgi:superfamily I DNA/RNA helicase
MHAAKGLEFPVVFIAGSEDGLMPYQRQSARTDLAEERRLLYVAMTRARDQLIFSMARKRVVHGVQRTMHLSPFVADIEAQLQRGDASAPPRPAQHQLSLF